MPNPSIGDAHVIAANVLAMICFWVYYKACAVGPGEVTAQNVKQCVQKH